MVAFGRAVAAATVVAFGLAVAAATVVVFGLAVAAATVVMSGLVLATAVPFGRAAALGLLGLLVLDQDPDRLVVGSTGKRKEACHIQFLGRPEV